MCFDPISLMLGIGQAVVSFAGAQADYENKAQQWKQNVINSQAAARDEHSQIQLRMTQEEDAFYQKDQQNILEGAEVSAEAEVSAGSAGLSGISLDNILNGINRKIQRKRLADKTNYENTAQQLTTQLEATDTTLKNRINSVQRPTAPNPLGYILQGIGGGLKPA